MLFQQRSSLPAFATIALLLAQISLGQKSTIAPILTRDVDKRPLPELTLSALSSEMRLAVHRLVKQTKHNSDMSGALHVTVQQIPVASRARRLYLVQLSGEDACAPAGVNCTLAVFDDSQENVVTVFGGQFADVTVIRRLHLQMPDIGARYQLGHSGNDMTVYRFSDGKWGTYACKKTSVTGDDHPHPEFVADAKCVP